MAKTGQQFTGHGPKEDRQFADLYETPANITQAIIDREKFNGSNWEPACGRGAISKVFKENGLPIISSDILPHGFGSSGVDFLNNSDLFNSFHRQVDNIITNPPFNKATEFVEMSKQYARQKVALFLRTSFLEGVARYHLFQDEAFPIARVYQFAKRVNFGKENGTHKNGGMIAFAWFIWDREHVGPPSIYWIL